jgi:outer membrane protein TolC
VRGQVQVERSLADRLLAQYRQTVLDALEEVENAMTAYARERDRRDKLARSVSAAEKSVELVQVLYKSGLTGFQNVLEMERSLFQQQDELVISAGLVTQNLISFYKALGGGWSPDLEVDPAEITNPDQLQPQIME